MVLTSATHPSEEGGWGEEGDWGAGGDWVSGRDWSTGDWATGQDPDWGTHLDGECHPRGFNLACYTLADTLWDSRLPQVMGGERVGSEENKVS